MSNRAQEVLKKALRVHFRPKVKLNACEWTERNIRLSAITSDIAGRFSHTRTPYFRRIYEDINNPRIRRIAIQKSAQIGASQFAANVALYYICNETLPGLMVLPSDKLAMQFSERCFTPCLFNCKAAREFIPDNPDCIKKTEFLFTSSIFRIVGGGSPAKLSSNAAALIIADEVDKYTENNDEANPLQLIEARAITFPHNRKILVLSTPTNASTSVIHNEFLAGSQSKYYCPCPKCGGFQVLDFNQIKWPEDCKGEGGYDYDRIKKEAYYECEFCQAKLPESAKVEMINRGEWRDTNPNKYPSDIRSYHINSLYSVYILWGELAQKFLLAKGDRSKLQEFKNHQLGEVFEQQAATVGESDVDKVIEASPHYVKGEILKTPEVLLLGADVQKNRLYWTIIAGYEDDTLSVVDYGEAATPSDLEIIFRKQYAVKDSPGELVGCSYGAVDAGYQSEKVYDLYFRSGRQLIPCFGRTHKHGLYKPVREDSMPYKNQTIRYIHVNDTFFKEKILLSWIKANEGGLYLPQDTSEEYKKHLAAERLVERKTKNGLEFEWICPSRNQHFMDSLKYAVALHHCLEPRLKAQRLQKPQPTTEPTKRQYTLQRSGWD